MSTSLTTGNKQLLRSLLKVGRWGNQSEIIRYGLHLVKREVEAEARGRLTPLSDEEWRGVNRAMRAERDEIRKLARGCPVPSRETLD